MISFQNITLKYIGKNEYTLKNINLDIKKGETILFLGKSGTGKSTLLNMVNGIIPNYLEGEVSGELLINGEDLSSRSIQELSKQVGSVFQNPKSQFFNLDTTDELLFGLSNHRASKETMEQRLKATINNLKIENLVDRNIFKLSGGEKQKIACSSVYMTDPNIVIFDEPSSNLDSDGIKDLRATIEQLKKEGKTILIAEHRIFYLMDLVDRIVYIENGEIEEILTTRELINMLPEKRESMGIRSPFEPVLLEKFKNNNSNIEYQQNWDLSIEDFSYSYSRGKQLWHIPKFRCAKGEIIGIMGKNGVGKTTLALTICGIMKAKGEVKIAWSNKPINAKRRRKICSMIMQDVNHQLFLDTVEKELLFISKSDDKVERATEIAEKLDLLEYLEAHPLSLSGGQKQRVVIASAIMDGKEIIIFDEPTSGLDFDSMNKVAGVIKNIAKDRIIFIISHDIEFINKICTRIFFLQ
ncbi:MAG: ABC transporter ATP-binding protein [Tissierellia bacterium]|nr:ABC transporter ATP-binding protein [Tissierellia bacterium]